MATLTIGEIVAVTNGECDERVGLSTAVGGFYYDTRLDVAEGSVFIARTSKNIDQSEFVEEALRRGSFVIVDEGQILRIERKLDERDRVKIIVVKNVTDATVAIARYVRKKIDIPVIAIGGSNGKTTTKDFCYDIMSIHDNGIKTIRNANGMLGAALTLLSPEVLSSDFVLGFIVLELGIARRGYMSALCELSAPDIGALTCLGPEHLDGLGSVEAGREEELVLMRQSKMRIWLISDPEILAFAKNEARRGDFLVVVDSSVNAIFDSGDFHVLKITSRAASGGRGFDCKIIYKELDSASYHRPIRLRLGLPGYHNVSNFSVALAGAIAAGFPLDSTRLIEEKLAIPPGRFDVVDLPGGATLIDSSYNATPSSMMVCLRALSEVARDRRCVLVLGDMLELGGESLHWHRKLADDLMSLSNKGLDLEILLTGEEMKEVAQYMAARQADPANPLTLIESESALARPSVFWFADLADIEARITKMDIGSSCVFVKGSNSMGLDRIVRGIKSRFSL